MAVRRGGGGRGRYDKRRTFHVFVRASASPRFEKAMKDLLPWKGWDMKGRRESRSSMRESGQTHFELEV